MRTNTSVLVGATFVLTTLLSTSLIHAQTPEAAQPPPAQAAPPAAAPAAPAPEVPGSGVEPPAAAAPAEPAPIDPAAANAEPQATTPEQAPQAGTAAAQRPESPPLSADVSEGQTPQVPEWISKVSIGGGAILYYYQPIDLDGAKNNFDVFFANLKLDGKVGRFGLHLEPRFRDTKLRPFYDGPVWLQEAYGYVDLDKVKVKVGKSYKLLGLFWDNSFYGNVQVYDGLKLDPNYGVSVEGAFGDKFGVEAAAQYFIVDGRTNVSLQGRDTFSEPGARRRNTFVGRVDGFVRFDPDGKARIGVSGETFEADFGDDDERVNRFAVDASVNWNGLGVWAEFLKQSGRHVTGFPYAGVPATDGAPAVPGRSSDDNNYFLVGAEYTLGPVTARYNFSLGNYSELDVKELMHVPAVSVKLSDNLLVLGEYVAWKRDTPEGDIDVDRSFNTTVHGSF